MSVPGSLEGIATPGLLAVVRTVVAASCNRNVDALGRFTDEQIVGIPKQAEARTPPVKEPYAARTSQ